MDKIRRIIAVALTATALLAAMAVPALAQPSIDAYNDVGGQTQGQIGGGDNAQGVAGQGPTTVSGAEGDGGALPFTGADLALLLGAGVLLAVAGVGMRRLTRAPGTA